MRITKKPEARKQEIEDTALRLFGEKGYGKASITDRSFKEKIQTPKTRKRLMRLAKSQTHQPFR